MARRKKTGSGCYVSDGKRTVELEIGWYKEWLTENAYCWHYVGPVENWPPYGPYVNLCVLGYEPSMDEVREIEKRFEHAVAPDGTAGMVCPL